MKKTTIFAIIFAEICMFLFLTPLFVAQIIIAVPFIFFYFIYWLIKSLMKYHNDLKQEEREKHLWN